jgi:hypothetical protein
MYRWVGEPHSRSLRYREEKNILPLPGIDTDSSVFPARHLLAIQKIDRIKEQK